MISLDEFKSKKIIVVGDIMLDRWLWGDAVRLSPEAPVPVVSVYAESWTLGGAGNVAANVNSLGGESFMYGVLGKDNKGAAIVVNPSDKILFDPTRRTTIKTRVIARDHHVVRFDEETVAPLPMKQHNALIKALEKAVKKVDGIILSDYGKGVLLDSVFISGIMQLAFSQHVPVFVDTKRKDATIFSGATLIAPSVSELSVLSGGMPTKTVEEIHNAVIKAELDLTAKAVLVKRGKDGMVLFVGSGKKMETEAFPSLADSVVDVSGAGDSVMAAMAMGYVNGFALHNCTLIASCAAAVAVGKPGTYCVTLPELKQRMAMKGYLVPVTSYSSTMPELGPSSAPCRTSSRGKS